MYAHLDRESGRIQDLQSHCKNVAALCRSAGKLVSFGSLAELCGWLHDMGKATELYQRYLRISSGVEKGSASRGSVHHAPVGAIYAYRRWYRTDAGSAERIAAQILIMVI